MAESICEGDWEERAEQLHEHGDVPEQRARVVALVAVGHTHAETADILDLNHRSNVGTHLARYRDERDEAAWLAEHGPEV